MALVVPVISRIIRRRFSVIISPSPAAVVLVGRVMVAIAMISIPTIARYCSLPTASFVVEGIVVLVLAVPTLVVRRGVGLFTTRAAWG